MPDEPARESRTVLATHGVRPRSESILLEDLIARQPLLAVIHSVLATIVAMVCGSVFGAWTATGWLSLVMATQLARLWAWHQFRQRMASVRVRALFLTVSSALSGCAWGLAGVLFFVVEPPSYQVFMPFILAGLCAGAVISLTGHMPAFYAFYLPTLLPYAGRLLVESEFVDQVMGWIVLLFGLGIGGVGLQLGRTLQRSADIALRNAELVDVLDQARQNLEHEVAARTVELSSSNRQLLAEVAQRRRSEARVRHLLQHDSLTGLPNRLLLQDRLQQALLTAQRQLSLIHI